MDYYRIAKRVSIITILLNLILGVFKILAGIFGRSSAMIADGFHTASDVISTFMVIIGVKISNKAADSDHPYGHEKFEPIFGKLISIFLIFVGFTMGLEGFKALIAKDFAQPGYIAIIAALVSIVTKEGMYWYTLHAANQIKSVSMKADAWHHRSDALSSIATLIGISAAHFSPKLQFLDPLMAVVVSLLVIKVGVDLYLESMKQLVDNAASPEAIKAITELALSVPGVLGICDLKTRVFGNRVYVDLEIYVDAEITVLDGHTIAQNTHDLIEQQLPDVKHCMIHIEPYLEEIISSK